MRHAKCHKYHNEERHEENQGHLINNIDEHCSCNNEKDSAINNAGCVDPMKHENNIRFFCVNPRGFGPDAHEKIMMLKQNKQRLQFDGAFFSSPDRSWNSRRIELLRKKV